MNNTLSEKTLDKAALHNAFIFYRPPSGISKEQLFYSQEILQIISMDSSCSEKENDILSYMSSLCFKWKELIEKSHEDMSLSAGRADSGSGHIAILESYRRKYLVSGIALSSHTSKVRSKQYLFVLKRIALEKINLPMVFRQYKLNNREQEIVRLLLSGRANKEIAHNLGLSPNTVKAYMKFLMLKIGVNNRAGIISALLAGNAGDVELTYTQRH